MCTGLAWRRVQRPAACYRLSDGSDKSGGRGDSGAFFFQKALISGLVVRDLRRFFVRNRCVLTHLIRAWCLAESGYLPRRSFLKIKVAPQRRGEVKRAPPDACRKYEPYRQAWRAACYLSFHFFRIRLALVPPKPKELHMAYSQAIFWDPSAI